MQWNSCLSCVVGGAILAAVLALGAGPAAVGAQDDEAAKPQRPLTLEVELARGKEISRLRVYLHNHTGSDISFATGARGGPGSLNDEPPADRDGERGAIIIGTAPTVLPVLHFGFGKGRIALAPPAFSGPTRRDMRPAQTTIAAGTRVLYASFAVPNAHVAGPFLHGELTVPGDAGALEPDASGMYLTTSELRELDPE